MFVLQGSQHKNLAFAFMNHLHDPRNAAKSSIYSHYAPTNKEAIKYLPTSFLKDSSIYLPQSILEKSEYYPVIPAKIQKEFNRIYFHVTH
jgi:spermidine/putrescine-binding protein